MVYIQSVLLNNFTVFELTQQIVKFTTDDLAFFDFFIHSSSVNFMDIHHG